VGSLNPYLKVREIGKISVRDFFYGVRGIELG